MNKVNRAWFPIEIVEVALLTLGVVLAITCRLKYPAWAAGGMGLIIEASVMLVFDLFAEQRALAYTDWLQQIVSLHIR